MKLIHATNDFFFFLLFFDYDLYLHGKYTKEPHESDFFFTYTTMFLFDYEPKPFKTLPSVSCIYIYYHLIVNVN